MSIDFAGIRAANPISDVVGRYVDLKRAGTEYRGLCPFHADKTPSFYVSPKKGKAFCMACHWAGDVVDFVAEIESVDLAEAARKLGAQDLPRDRLKPAPLPPDTSDEWRPILPVPDDAPAYDPAATFNPKRGRAVRYQPVRTWAYRDAAGQLLGYVLRLEIDGAKITPTITYCQHADGTRRWCTRPFPTPRPLYGLDKLAARPTAPVVVVEGEKAADAAQRGLPGMVVVTWPGGTNGVRWANLEPLQGRDLVFWPDADDPGVLAMIEVASRVNGSRERWIDTTGLAKGDDAADVTGDLVAFCKERVRATPPEEIRKVQPAAQEGESARQGEEPSETLGGTAAVVESAITRVERAIPVTRIKADLDATADPADNMPAKYSEINVGLRFAGLYDGDLRYVDKWGRWMVYDGARWVHDEIRVAFERSKQLCCAVAEYARMDQVEFTTERQRQATIARYGEKRTVVNIADLAKSDPRIAARADQWDAEIWALNTPGGVVDLCTGSLRPARREDYMTRMTRVTPGGDCPTWRRFLDVATAGDVELQRFMQRVAGYCLTGSTRDHALFFVYGTGGNGKGTFINTFKAILGGYAQAASMSTFTEQKHDDHPTALAGMMGARLVTAQETEEGKRWAESRIKALTGGDPIRARFMRQDEFEFIPQFKLLFAGNHKPGLRNVDEAMKRRLHLIPFTVTVQPEDRDPALPEKLESEAAGILAWAIEGCLEWQRIGLKPPAAVLAATAEYLEQQDNIAAWIEERCVVHTTISGKRGPLYQSYKEWAEEAGEFALPQKRWIGAMEHRGFRSRILNGAPMFDGIGLKDRGL